MSANRPSRAPTAGKRPLYWSTRRFESKRTSRTAGFAADRSASTSSRRGTGSSRSTCSRRSDSASGFLRFVQARLCMPSIGRARRSRWGEGGKLKVGRVQRGNRSRRGSARSRYGSGFMREGYECRAETSADPMGGAKHRGACQDFESVSQLPLSGGRPTTDRGRRFLGFIGRPEPEPRTGHPVGPTTVVARQDSASRVNLLKCDPTFNLPTFNLPTSRTGAHRIKRDRI